MRITFAFAFLCVACGDDSVNPPTIDAPMIDGGGGSDGAPVSALHATLVDRTFLVADHMRASIEMQISGEPFAQLLGYDLAGFNRSNLSPDIYKDPVTHLLRFEPLGWALAIESYEYSKQPMNNLSFESGAGLSLQFGPLVNPSGATGDPAYTALVNRFQLFAVETNSGGLPGQNYITSPAPTDNPLNRYGWPGLWPVFAEFATFDPSITPMAAYTAGCSLLHGNFGTYGGGGVPAGVVGNYECDYNSLNLTPRDQHVTKVLSPDALGYASWKQGLWVVNYWGTLHDVAGNQPTIINAADRPMVGQPGNTVVGYYPDPNDPTGMTTLPGQPGTYFGDVPIEGWQGLLMIEENDNKAALLLSSLLSSDGATLTGLTVQGALEYSYDSPLRFFPSQIAVTETATAPDAQTATKYFPKPTAFTIMQPKSRLRDLSGLIGGMGEIFILTDANNAGVGGTDPLLVTFDGDPFPADDGTANGEQTLHDRTLAVMKVALVDLDRLHLDAQNHVLVDEVTVAGTTITRGTTVSTVELAESILALRNAYRALNSSLQLYSNDTPDTLGAPSQLDATPTTGKTYTGTLSSHIIALIRLQADFLAQKLVKSSGAVANGYDLTANAPDAAATTLESETAAIRGLLDAYLATSDTSYRQVATAVYADLVQRFWVADLKLFETTAGNATTFEYSPLRFGIWSGALRQYYKLVASQPGREAEAMDLLAKFTRMHKLILNGWDDVNADLMVDWPAECIGAGLEMGERALTGEFAKPSDMGDRDQDCVREISAVGLPAALGADLEITRR
jgi:hypothetical protein